MFKQQTVVQLNAMTYEQLDNHYLDARSDVGRAAHNLGSDHDVTRAKRAYYFQVAKLMHTASGK